MRRSASREHAHAYFASNWRALALFIASLVLVLAIIRFGS
jgi:hypothetical protein